MICMKFEKEEEGEKWINPKSGLIVWLMYFMWDTALTLGCILL